MRRSLRARDRLVEAARRVSGIKRQYGNMPAEDDLLRRFLRDKLTGPRRPLRSPHRTAPGRRGLEIDGSAGQSAPPGEGKSRDSPGKTTPSQP